MRLTIVSFFRDAAGVQVHRFIKQCVHLQAGWKGPVRLVAVYGDCVDSTKQQLQAEAEAYNLALHLVEYNTNKPRFGSTEEPDRMATLSKMANHALDYAQSLLEPGVPEQIFYVESDLIWEPETVKKLGEILDRAEDIDAIAPLIYAGELFYDIWGFRGMDDIRFAPFPPYHFSLTSTDPTQIHSCGSAFMMERWVLEKSRIRNDYALVGFWEDARSHGFKLFVAPTLKVRHPA